MNETIEKLIASGKEGPWWDFKQTYHQNNAALVHDILCMANVLHDGDRYLIFGVTYYLSWSPINEIGTDGPVKNY